MSTLKKHILVVEDHPIIYDEVLEVLEEAGFVVDAYTPSVEKAIERIEAKRPDLVLLDIDLKGEKNGIELGHILRNKYHIPYIYVTDFDDDYTFNQSAQSQPEAFLSKKTMGILKEDVVVKTKPFFDTKQLIRQITLSLQKNQVKPDIKDTKTGILAFTDYKSKQVNYGNDEVTQVLVPYKDIAYFTTNSDLAEKDNDRPKKFTESEKMKDNNTRVYTWRGESFVISSNLKPILKVLPNYFERISSDYVISLNPDYIDGRINGKHIKVCNQKLTISETYKKSFNEKLQTLFQTM